MMFKNWKSRIRAKRARGKSERAGNNKPTCQTNPLKKFFFCNPKAYKHPQYNVWHRKAKKMNGDDK
jgi:hypothetical protein